LGITLAREAVSEVWEEALPLVTANHNETGALPNADFAPQKATYEALEKAGILKVFTARDAAVLVGYAVFIVSPHHLHYPSTSWAIQDVLYVDPKSRGAMPYRFMAYQDISLRADKVDLVYRHNTLHKDYSRLLLHLGYRAEEVRYFRDLREEVA
jgi:hypothetical protein